MTRNVVELFPGLEDQFQPNLLDQLYRSYFQDFVGAVKEMITTTE